MDFSLFYIPEYSRYFESFFSTNGLEPKKMPGIGLESEGVGGTMIKAKTAVVS